MANLARDYFERFFAEKMWAMIPASIRNDDSLAQPPGVLRAFIETLAIQAAHLRRSADHRWDDSFIDLCSEWAVPYIGELMGTRLVSALDRRARRVDVAKTIYYRRRKGTSRVLEELIADISGWEGKIVEEFRRLGRMRHGLDPHAGPLAGKVTGTLPGGWADMRNPAGATLAFSAFDEFHHTPDSRQPRGRDGRYGIAKVTAHLYRLASTRLDGVDPRSGPCNNTFTFDPSGRDIPLFVGRRRQEDRDRINWDEWRSAERWQLPAPVGRHLLGQSEYVITEAALIQLKTDLLAIPLLPAIVDPAIAKLRPFRTKRFVSEEQLRLATNSAFLPQIYNPSIWANFLKQTLVAECGRSYLLPEGASTVDVAQSSLWISVGGLVAGRQEIAEFIPRVNTDLTGKTWSVDPVKGRLQYLGAGGAPQPLVGYHYGFSGPIGAGGHDRSDFVVSLATLSIQGGGSIVASGLSNVLTPDGVVEIADSRTYSPVDDRNQVTNLEFRATDGRRPYLRLTHDWRFTSNPTPPKPPTLTLDGLWAGSNDGLPKSIVLAGAFDKVVLSNMTLDPGGFDASGLPIPEVSLRVEGFVDELVIDHSITGAIVIDPAATLEKLVIQDSIIQGPPRTVAPNPLKPAISSLSGEIHLLRSTVMGDIDLPWLYASNALITGFADVTNTQAGCFRFSAVLRRRDPTNPASTHSRVPHPYESHFLDDATGIFTSAVFGAPGFGQLAQNAPAFLLRGGVNQCEIGAFHSLRNPIRFDSLRAKIDEFAPFGILPVYIFET
jgi:hypothetical protein